MFNIHRHQISYEFNGKKIIKIKLSADGAQIGKKAKLLNFTFSFLNQMNNTKFVDENFTLGIFDYEIEDYETVNTRFRALLDELASVKNISIVIGNVTETIDTVFYFAADQKILANLLGINGAQSNYPCIYCTCSKTELYHSGKEWSITDISKNARATFNEAVRRQHEKEQKGQKNIPLIDFIPFHNFVFDLLHANLRISEVLFSCFFSRLGTNDAKDRGRDRINKRQELFKKYLIEQIRIFNPVYMSTERNVIKMTLKNFDRNENLRILSETPLQLLFPDVDRIVEIERTWRLFYQINVNLIENQWQSNEIKLKTKEWLDLFISSYAASWVTPYMHMMTAHLHQLHELHVDLNRFSCQQLEEKNYSNTKNIFQSTNMHTNLGENDDFLMQLIHKNNRLEYMKKFTCISLNNRKRRISFRQPKFFPNFRKTKY